MLLTDTLVLRQVVGMEESATCFSCQLQRSVRRIVQTLTANLDKLGRCALGGCVKDPFFWCIAVGNLGADLQFRQDSATHGLIEPARTMTIDELAAGRPGQAGAKECTLARAAVAARAGFPGDPISWRVSARGI